MAIENTNILNAPANEDLLKNRLISDEQKIVDQQPKEVASDEKTITPDVVIPSSTTTQPTFSKNERLSLTLLPLASALLQGKRSGSGSLLGDTLASLGTGLAGTTDVALKIKQLEAADRTKKSSTLKQYKLQTDPNNPNKKVQVGGASFTPDMNKIFQLSVDDVNAYPQGTFVEVTKAQEEKITKVDIREDFTIDGKTYKKGKGVPVPQSVILKQNNLDPSVFGDTTTTNLSAPKKFIFQEEVTVNVNGKDITIPKGEQLVAPEVVTAVNQQIGVGKVKEAPKEYKPDSFTKQLTKVKGILAKVTDESNTLDNKVDVLSDEDIFDLKAYADKIGKKQTYTIIENGVTKTFEETPIDIFNNYKIAYGETAYKDLLERIFLGKEGSRALEQELVKLEGDSPRNFIMNFDEAEVALGDKKKLLSQSVKPLSGTDAQKLASAESALNAIKNAKSIIFDNEGNIRTGILAAPGSRFYEAGRKKQYYRRAIRMATEILLRARSGAAVPESEFQRYDKMYVPSIFDAPEVAKMKILALENEFSAMRLLLDTGRGQDLQKGIKYDADGKIISMSPLSGANEGLDLNNNESFKNKAKTDDGFSGND